MSSGQWNAEFQGCVAFCGKQTSVENVECRKRYVSVEAGARQVGLTLACMSACIC